MHRIIRKLFRFKWNGIIGVWKKNVLLDDSSYSNFKFVINGENNTIQIGHDSIIDSGIVKILGSNHKLIIGKRCRIKQVEFWFEDSFNTIIIDDDTTIESAKFAVVESNLTIQLGKDCMLSESIYFRTSDSHSIVDLKTNKRINYGKSICIGNHVWIGANVTVLKGVRAEDNCIIGANSLVTHNVESNTIVAGTPAKKVNENVNWDRKRI
ncbi:MAG: acyltransferase [Bacteroidetes bacterium HGW-Bacteroidetes-4]|jgi:acetyltransferase-like isoleucine patch superfamily enzyme|nr:MAG: acyltransferase [Bacteroidetes bacterium HGW-Bacteroidetes-4]